MKRIVFKKFAGFVVKGKSSVIKPVTARHVDNAVWLTAMVESDGKFGTAMNYDGTGMTASIGQAVAVYPKALVDNVPLNSQGPLWKILARISPLKNSKDASADPIKFFFNAIENIGWVISEDGKCRYVEDGLLVSGRQIRKEFTGSVDGVVPVKGPHNKNAQNWITLFSNLFSCPETFEIQLAVGREHIIKNATRAKFRFCKEENSKNYTVNDWLYWPFEVSTATTHLLGPELDLALSLYWCNSVNAPSYALKRICKQVVDKIKLPETDRIKLAKKIVKALGNAPFARWDDDIKGGRYQRTRKYAMQLWPKELFEGPSAIMPKDLKG